MQDFTFGQDLTKSLSTAAHTCPHCLKPLPKTMTPTRTCPHCGSKLAKE